MTATLSSNWSGWFAAVRLSSVHQAVQLVYDQLDIAIRARGPVCWSSGKCCNFEMYGHRLYVTGLEIAWVLGEISSSPKASAVTPRGGCPFQIENLCSIHPSRPLGCRVFFCQQGTQSWQHEVYERFLSEIRVLHEQHALPYQYMEWRLGLREAIEYLESSIAETAPRQDHNKMRP